MIWAKVLQAEIDRGHKFDHVEIQDNDGEQTILFCNPAGDVLSHATAPAGNDPAELAVLYEVAARAVLAVSAAVNRR